MSTSTTSRVEDLRGERHPLRMTEEEFLAWVDGDAENDRRHAEWVDGEVILMAPVSGEHDKLQWWIRSLIEFYVQDHDLGEVRGPEFSLRLHRRRREPDIAFIGKDRLDRIRPAHIEGAPDLVLEIVSPDSVARDWREKYLEYEANGVREYWVVDPLAQRIEAYVLGADQKYAVVAEADGKLASGVLPGWYLRPVWLWAEKRPDVRVALAELSQPR